VKPRVILADDHVMVAEGLGRLISEVAELVARVTDGAQLVESGRRLRPDIIVSDITMPVMSGLDAMRQLKLDRIPAPFIFLTIHTDAHLAAEAMRAGARGYLLKQAAGEELLEAIRVVMAGHTYLTPLITSDVLWAVSQPGLATPALSPRQLDVLRLVAQGKRMKEIAVELGISVRTVEGHKSQLQQVLGVEGTAELVRFAIRRGVIRE
jgi:two-component system, NarL family, response regulator NreC